MRVCVFEDRSVPDLEPLSLTRPAFDLWCGMSSLLMRHQLYTRATEVGVLVRTMLAPLCRVTHPQLAVNDLVWLRADRTVMMNARWLPPLEPPTDWETPRVALVGEEVAYAILPPDQLTYCSPNTIDDCTQSWKYRLPQVAAGGRMIGYPWDLVEANAATLCQDFEVHSESDTSKHDSPSDQMTVVGPKELLRVDASARIDPLVVADTTQGPVVIGSNVKVQAFSYLQGPCYVGAHSQVLSARLRGASIGPGCRVGGEVEASVIQGFTNKYHDGFLGHSYVGEWVNLGAGTQVSDLRLDYRAVQVSIHGQVVNTGLTKFGAIIGDHTKLGLATLLNTGSIVGPFCNLLPAGRLLPRAIPSFCAYWNGQLVEQANLHQLLATADTVMKRRDCELTNHHVALYRALYDQTAADRRHLLREHEQRHLRLSA